MSTPKTIADTIRRLPPPKPGTPENRAGVERAKSKAAEKAAQDKAKREAAKLASQALEIHTSAESALLDRVCRQAESLGSAAEPGRVVPEGLTPAAPEQRAAVISLADPAKAAGLDQPVTIPPLHQPASGPAPEQPAPYCEVVPRGKSLKYTAQDPKRPGVITHYNGKPVTKTPETATKLDSYKWLAAQPADSEKTLAKLAKARAQLEQLIADRAPDVDYDSAYYRHCSGIWSARKADKESK